MNPLTLLKELIAIPSVNPMGHEPDLRIAYERRLSDFLVDFFTELHIECERIEVQPHRYNVIARVPGTEGTPTILLDAHLDTVPVDGMTIEPFDPVERDGRIFGRGACDVKGGMAAMICAMERISRLERTNRPAILLACTCDEELHQRGAEDIVRRMYQREGAGAKLSDRAPDMAIVAEPTGLNIGVTHRGVVRWTMRTHGEAAHSSDPSRGENAIYRMAKLVTALEQYAGCIASPNHATHRLCGPRTLSVGMITGGQSVNIVPAQCSIEVDRRTLPGETAPEVMDDVNAYLRKRLDFDFEMLQPHTVAAPLSDDNNRQLAESLHRAAKPVSVASQIVGLPFTTHAPQYAGTGVPTVVFGPGSIKQAHTADEWLAIEQLERATEILYQFLVRHCVPSGQ